jgi:DNA replication and repair protein RecF
VYIEWIQGIEFRSYGTLSYSPVRQLNILIGPNGHGKSNLLEAIALLVVGRSFRGARPAEMRRWDANEARLSGELRQGDVTRSLRREIAQREDGTWTVSGEGCPWARVVPFSWQDLAILNGTPQARRNFLDGFAGKLLPAHLTALNRYRQVVIRRNAILQSPADDASLRASLAAWDEQMATLAVEIGVRRRRAVAALRQEASRIHAELGGPGPLELRYQSTLAEGASASAVVDALAARFREERRRGQTLVGPHRDDLLIELGGHDARAFGSRGQQRLVALALRLAEVEPVAAAVGSAPILLLDDALSELDPDVQEKVLRYVSRGGQVFLTTAETAPPAVEAAWWDVRENRVAELEPVGLGAA